MGIKKKNTLRSDLEFILGNFTNKRLQNLTSIENYDVEDCKIRSILISLYHHTDKKETCIHVRINLELSYEKGPNGIFDRQWSVQKHFFPNTSLLLHGKMFHLLVGFLKQGEL